MALAKLRRGKIKSYNDKGKDFFIFSFFSLQKKTRAFSKKIFSLLFKTFQNKARKEKFLSIFFQTQEIQVLEKVRVTKRKATRVWP
jgi:hypothetical protein